MPKDKIKLKVEAKKKAEEFAAVLERKRFPFRHVYLYGSFARGNFHSGSDIDICVVSDKFKRNGFNQEVKLGLLGSSIDLRIEPIGLTSEEFNDEIHPLAFEVKKRGIRIK